MNKNINIFFEKIKAGFGVSDGRLDALKDTFLDDLKNARTLHLIDWAASYRSLIDGDFKHLNISVLHKCLVYISNSDIDDSRTERVKREHEQRFCSLMAHPERLRSFIRDCIDLDTEYPTAMIYECREASCFFVLKEIYAAAKALEECPEKDKLRKHYQKYKNKKIQNLTVNKILNNIIKKSVVFEPKQAQSAKM